MNVLIIIDMQNDFLSGVLGTKEALLVEDNVVKRIKNSNNELILFTQDTHCNNYLNTQEGKKLPILHCLENTWGHEISKPIISTWQENQTTIRHSQLNNNTFVKRIFASMSLIDFLKNKEDEINQIQICGLCTDICVITHSILLKNTLPATNIQVIANCSAGTTPASHKEALNIMEKCHIDII